MLLLLRFIKAQMKQRQKLRMQELIGTAQQLNIEVRTEKLLREVGYKPRSGRCRVNGQEVILIDRDAPISEQIEFLASELNLQNPEIR
jgi:proline racemase